MAELTDSTGLLREIRDLLEALLEAQFDAYRMAVVERLGSRAAELAKAVNGDNYWKALSLMDGLRAQSELAGLTAIDGGNMSRFVAKLKKAGFVEDGPRGPRASLTPWELRAVRSAA